MVSGTISVSHTRLKWCISRIHHTLWLMTYQSTLSLHKGFKQQLQALCVCECYIEVLDVLQKGRGVYLAVYFSGQQSSGLLKNVKSQGFEHNSHGCCSLVLLDWKSMHNISAISPWRRNQLLWITWHVCALSARYIGFPHSIKDLEQLSPGIKIILCDLCQLWLSDFREVWSGCDPRRSSGSVNSVDRWLLFLASQRLREQGENSMFVAVHSIMTLERLPEHGALFEFECVRGQAAAGPLLFYFFAFFYPPLPSLPLSPCPSVHPSVGRPPFCCGEECGAKVLHFCLSMSVKSPVGESLNSKACPPKTSVQHRSLMTGNCIWCICQITWVGVCARRANRETLRGQTKNI